MPNFKYKAVNPEGKIVQSVLLAPDKQDVVRQLTQQKMVVISVDSVKSSKRADQMKLRIKESTIIHFTKQLYTLLKAGVPIVGSLKALNEQTSDEGFKKVIETITQDIEGGSKFSDALSQFPKIFPSIFINSVKVGEISGTLEDTLLYLYNYLEEDSRMRKEVKKALRYPMFVFIGIIGAFIVFTTVVIPNFMPMFENAKQELPLPTKILVFINYAITEYGLLVLIVLAAIISSIIFYVRTPKGRYNFDLLLLKLPVFGEFLQKVNISRFSKLFYTMNRTGISITKAFEIIQETMDNSVYSKELKIVADKINRGDEIAASVAQSPFFTNLLVEMISIGEKSGSLDDMLLSVSDYYNREVTDTVNNMTSLIEPIVTLVLGGMILLLTLAMFLPMWNMMDIL